MELPPLPRTLILDYYDSYTNNLLTLFTKLYSDAEVLRKVVVVKADRYSWDQFRQDVLPNVDCVILSPGPGRPDKSSDIGFALELLRLHPVPILGVCLGHQAIGVAFGGKIINTPQITHGHVVPVLPVHPALGLFASPAWKDGFTATEPFEVVVYNSLTVDPTSLPDQLEVTAWSVPAPGKERTVQGLRHKEFPIWGVQYHPESISSTRGTALLRSFLLAVDAHHSNPKSYPSLLPSILSACAYRVAAAPSSRPSTPRTPGGGPWPTPPISPEGSQSSGDEADADEGARLNVNANVNAVGGLNAPGRVPRFRGFRLVERSFGEVGKGVETREVFEQVVRSRKGKERAVGEIWLDGQTPLRSTTASLAIPSFVLTYALSSRTVSLHRQDKAPITLDLGETTFWDWFSDGQATLAAHLPPQVVRGGWRGGWVGWFGYEMKEESLAGYRRRPKAGNDAGEQVEEVDACWAWVPSMAQRTGDGEWLARAVLGNVSFLPSSGSPEAEAEADMISWLVWQGIKFGASVREYDELVTSLSTILSSPQPSKVDPAPAFPTFRPIATGDDYRGRIDSCREAIRQGESYELTLTTRFESQIPSSSSTRPTNADADADATGSNSVTDPYELYLRLRTFNPAYYSAWMSFPSLSTPRGHGVHVLSSSPERFLRIEGGQVEMMPIKGTMARVKPGQCVYRRPHPLRPAVVLHPVNRCGPEAHRAGIIRRAQPRDDCAGQVGAQRGDSRGGQEVFPASVQLLDKLEAGRRRGIYSGALGYIGVDGETDLSVVIRTIVLEGDRLSIGAGGAITWLSDRHAEWDEVLTKVRSVVGVLDGVDAAPFLPCNKTEYTLTGSPKLYNELGDSGKPVERGFCGDCGSSLWYADGIKPHQIYFHGGLFDPQTIPAPTHELFTRNMEVWEKSYEGEGVFSEAGQRV
ncbi:Protein phosphatase PP2A regulatory subunit B [Saitozyma podzolica]|uniref:aminodeoxychorismate synthase n=1 Tax=Saitozyma podzolica TaxID=1890683 RepID=A0A427XZ14_9TREE|nr:Protein phosphatase PP2A regulatory subunit B [Saitozyma podzolica]